MAKIFIFSNSFVSRNILYEINYVLNISIDKVLLLGENHNRNENFNICGNIIVEIYKDLDMCINCCDVIILIEEKNIPQDSIDYICSLASAQGKKCVRFKNPWIDMLENYEYPVRSVMKNRPVIFIIFMGVFSLPYYTEILMNKMFSENNVKIKQVFTKHTELFLNCLNDYGVLSSELSNSMYEKNDDYNVIIYSFVLEEKTINFIPMLELLNYVDPDFIILQSNFKCEKLDEVKNAIYYSCSKEVDVMIHSKYYKFNDRNNVYCQDKVDKGRHIASIESKNIREMLEMKIFPKLALPNGIYPI